MYGVIRKSYQTKKYDIIFFNYWIRDYAIIIRKGGGGAEKLEAGRYKKIAAKIGGAQSKISHLTEGGP